MAGGKHKKPKAKRQRLAAAAAAHAEVEGYPSTTSILSEELKAMGADVIVISKKDKKEKMPAQEVSYTYEYNVCVSVCVCNGACVLVFCCHGRLFLPSGAQNIPPSLIAVPVFD